MELLYHFLLDNLYIMDDLQVKLHSALGVAHQVLCELLSSFSLQHKDAKSDDAGVALANIFRKKP